MKENIQFFFLIQVRYSLYMEENIQIEDKVHNRSLIKNLSVISIRLKEKRAFYIKQLNN